MNSFDPFLTMGIGIRRVNQQGDIFGPDQRIDRLAALRMMTAVAAWVGFRENEIGSLEPGKCADLVLIDRDFLSCPNEEIAQIKVLATMVGCRVVYGHF